MSDRKYREKKEEFERTGSVEAGAAMAMLAARNVDRDGVMESLSALADVLTLKQIRFLLVEFARAERTRTHDDRKNNEKEYETIKAFEIHLPDITDGPITVGELVAILGDAVYDAVNGQAKSNPHMSCKTSRRSGFYSVPIDMAKDQVAKKAEKAFEEYTGEFVISASAPLRVYAIKKKLSDEEKKERAKLLKERKKREAYEKRAKELEEQEKRLEKLRKQKERLAKELGLNDE